MVLRWAEMESPVGRISIFSDEAGRLKELWIGKPGPRDLAIQDEALLAEAVRQLSDYFNRERTEFNLPLDPEGTDFQREVWAELQRIPFGQTTSYGELAERLGSKLKTRAVGRANGQNPIAIIIPCHRVIGANGDLTGYAGGLEVKRALLEHEGVLSPSLW